MSAGQQSASNREPQGQPRMHALMPGVDDCSQADQCIEPQHQPLAEAQRARVEADQLHISRRERACQRAPLPGTTHKAKVFCTERIQACLQARTPSGNGNASKRSSSSPKPSWNNWLLRSVSPSPANSRASSAQASGLRSMRRLLSSLGLAFQGPFEQLITLLHLAQLIGRASGAEVVEQWLAIGFCGTLQMALSTRPASLGQVQLPLLDSDAFATVTVAP
ncbi:hypothetical protein WR25_01576 [Diploscapter pachys]|uniref:Uncharacterized protein n=1 Tax=Diploscapter pachys TaxID=2018661 RepID=A0A2A2K0C0_9BILA|nr:hypothetical protein WR25_01576 [Diploscapter pachys]